MPFDFCSYNWRPFVAGSALEWVDNYGGVGVAVECGFHDNPKGGEIALSSTRIFLQHLGIDDFGEPNASCRRALKITAQETVADPRTFNYTRDYKNFEPVKPEEIIAADDRREYRAPNETGLVIVFVTTVDRIRDARNPDAYFLGRFHDL